MGDPRKPRKAYQTPRHPWRKDQLEEELHLVGEYGLRNKRELRGHETELSQIRGIARTLLGGSRGTRPTRKPVPETTRKTRNPPRISNRRQHSRPQRQRSNGTQTTDNSA